MLLVGLACSPMHARVRVMMQDGQRRIDPLGEIGTGFDRDAGRT
ncbi:long-chain fatty acid transporter [Moniliophthora roreri]|nr:long-chain fatty acid transporter [Moniliophthora roreri]